jgi:hypothetical protein
MGSSLPIVSAIQMASAIRNTGARAGSGQPARGAARRARRAGASEAIFDGDRRRNVNGGGGRNQPFILLSARQLCIMQQSNQANSATTQSDLSHTLWYPCVRILWVGFQPSPCSEGTRSGCFLEYETHWREKPAPYCADVELLVPFKTIVFQVGSKGYVAGIARELDVIVLGLRHGFLRAIFFTLRTNVGR